MSTDQSNVKSGVLLCIDIGTSGGRVVAFDLSGCLLGASKMALSLSIPKPGYAELDAEVLWGKVCGAIGSLGKMVDLRDVVGIGVSAQLGLVAIDGCGKALAPAITWMDRRALECADSIRHIVGQERIFSITGRRVDPELVACKVLWIRQYAPDLYRSTTCFLSIKDYIVYQLTGELATDYVHASYTLLFDIQQKKWSQELCKALGIDKHKLPEVRHSSEVIGRISKSAAAATSLCSGIPVIVGGPDGTVGAIGAGLVDVGSAVCVLGTTSVFFVCTNEPVLDQTRRLVVNCHSVSDKWTLGGPMTTTGGCLDWFVRGFVCNEDETDFIQLNSQYEMVDKEAEQILPGADGLVFLPSLVGERTPTWNPKARGVLFGLSIHHRRAHIARAIMEGSAYLVREVIDIIEELGIHVENFRLTGGGSRSSLWAQIHADATGRCIEIPSIAEATCLGTAILTGYGIGLYTDLERASRDLVQITRRFAPKSDSVPIYRNYFELYKALRDGLIPTFELLDDLRKEPTNYVSPRRHRTLGA